jgi:DNA-directed RNA polymerase subunit E'/Rpb7
MSEPTSLYSKAILSKPVSIPFTMIGSNIREILQKQLVESFEGKCIKEGFMRPNSIEILTYSSGVCKHHNIMFQVTFSCVVCFPVEGMKVRISITNITKAGVRGKSRDPYSPIDVFIARDHNINNLSYQNAKLDDELFVVIVGQRYELYDKVIAVIADIADDQTSRLLVRPEEEKYNSEDDDEVQDPL